MNTNLIAWIFRANLFFFAILTPILFNIFPDAESGFFRIATSLLLLTVIFILPAVNVTAILSKIPKKPFDGIEFASIATIVSILLIPLTFSLEADMLNILSPKLPIINSIISFALLSTLFRSKTHGTPGNSSVPEPNRIHSILTSFILALFIATFSIFTIVTAYYPLPDLDPYYWITTFQNQFTSGVISSLSSSRPLFSSLAYLFNQAAGVDLYAFFKYLIPFFTLFPIIPAALIARRFSGTAEQLSILLLPFANASFLLYSTIPIPQAIFNSLLVAAILFTVHSILSGKKEFFHATGLVLFAGFFYHEMAALPLLAWLFSFLLLERKNLLRFARTNRIATGLIFLLILSNLSFVSPIFSFVVNWAKTVSEIIAAAHPNFAFPAEYVNIDGNSVGWQDTTGVIRYYAFYFGPAALLVLLLFPFTAKDPNIRPLFRQEGGIFLSISLSIFLLISDIFPRFFNIALLPERALGFASLFLLSSTPFFFLALHGRKRALFRLAPTFLLIAFLINLGAALYINNLKKYLITPGQIASAEWIRSNLPTDRIIFSFDNYRLIQFYSNSTVANIDNPAFYSDESTLEKYLREYVPGNQDSIGVVRRQLSTISDSLADLSNKQALSTNDFLQNIRKESKNLEDIDRFIKETQEGEGNGDVLSKRYIYYAAPSEKNPYINRPYISKMSAREEEFIFNEYPDRFRMIYSDEENKIYLWEIL